MQTHIPRVTTVIIGLKNRISFQVAPEMEAAVVTAWDNRRFVPENKIEKSSSPDLDLILGPVRKPPPDEERGLTGLKPVSSVVSWACKHSCGCPLVVTSGTDCISWFTSFYYR